MANKVTITNNSNKVTITPQSTNGVSTSTNNTPITVTQGVTRVVKVNTLGPQGPTGPTGPIGTFTSGDDVVGRNITASNDISASGNLSVSTVDVKGSIINISHDHDSGGTTNRAGINFPSGINGDGTTGFNDGGFIRHTEDGNTGIIEIVPSDDVVGYANDRIVFGYRSSGTTVLNSVVTPWVKIQGDYQERPTMIISGALELLNGHSGRSGDLIASGFVSATNITASGNISSSGDIIAPRFIASGSNTTSGFVFPNPDNLTDLVSNRITLTSAQNMQFRAGGNFQFASIAEILNGNALMLKNDGNDGKIHLENKGTGIESRIRFRTGSGANVVELMTISGSGNVGIGTTTPQEKLVVKDGNILITGSSTHELEISTTNSVGKARLRLDTFREGINAQTGLPRGMGSSNLYKSGALTFFDTDEDFKIRPNSRLALNIGGTGDIRFVSSTIAGDDPQIETTYFIGDASTRSIGIGIGNTAPSAPLHISSSDNTLLLVESSDGLAHIAFKDDITTDANKVRVGAAGDELQFIAGGTERGRFDSNGNLGIGTSNPSQLLTVSGGFVMVTGSGPAGYGYLLDRAGFDRYEIRHLDGGLTIKNATDNRKEMSFIGNGNIGIGNSDPTKTLTVEGDISASGHISASGLFISGADGITIMGNRSTSGSIKFFDNDTSASIELTVKDSIHTDLVSAGNSELSGLFVGRGNEGSETGFLGWSNLTGGGQQYYLGSRDGGELRAHTTTVLEIKQDHAKFTGVDRLIIEPHVTASGNISSSGDIIATNVSASILRISNPEHAGQLRFFQDSDNSYQLVSNIGTIFDFGSTNVITTSQRIDGTRGMTIKTFKASDLIKFRDFDSNDIIVVDNSGSLTLGNASGHEPHVTINTDLTASGNISASGDISAVSASFSTLDTEIVQPALANQGLKVIGGNNLELVTLSSNIKFRPGNVQKHTFFDSGKIRFNSAVSGVEPTSTIDIVGSVSASSTGSFEQIKLSYDTMPTSDPNIKGVIYRSSSLGLNNLLFISAG